jgi:hypothetical protein
MQRTKHGSDGASPLILVLGRPEDAMNGRGRRLAVCSLLACVLASQAMITAASGGSVVEVTIAPTSGVVEFSIIQKNAVMQHGRTAAAISRTIAKDAWLALVVQAQPGQEVSVSVKEGSYEHASARGQNVSLTMVGGRASVAAFE